MDAGYLQSKHNAGLSWKEYLATGTADQQANWNKIYNQATLTDAQVSLIKGFTRQVKVVGLSGIWCGDCVQQCPLVQKIADASNGLIDIRYVDRDVHADLQKELKICGGNRVPVFVFCAEDFEPVSIYGDRTLARYRAIAQRQLGPSCPLPGAPVSADEMAATLSDWLGEVERVSLLLRLSARLRQKHND
jgi:thiol-disulfide isomerase/thioredoxin